MKIISEPTGSGLSEALYSQRYINSVSLDAVFLYLIPQMIGEIMAYVQAFIELKVIIVITVCMISELPVAFEFQGDFCLVLIFILKEENHDSFEK